RNGFHSGGHRPGQRQWDSDSDPTLQRVSYSREAMDWDCVSSTIETIFRNPQPFLLIGVCLVLSAVFRRKAGMTKHLDRVIGPELRCSSWGSALINGVSFRNIVMLPEHDDG